MQPLTLFYSWQMDRPTKVCRDFIRSALEEAAAKPFVFVHKVLLHYLRLDVVRSRKRMVGAA